MAAAVIHDALAGLYQLSNLAVHALGDRTYECDANPYGGAFCDAKDAWLEKETSFNVDKVGTPILFAGHEKPLPSTSSR